MPRETTTCPTCGTTVGIDREGCIVPHPGEHWREVDVVEKDWLGRERVRTDKERMGTWCEGSGKAA